MDYKIISKYMENGNDNHWKDMGVIMKIVYMGPEK